MCTVSVGVGEPVRDSCHKHHEPSIIHGSPFQLCSIENQCFRGTVQSYGQYG